MTYFEILFNESEGEKAKIGQMEKKEYMSGLIN